MPKKVRVWFRQQRNAWYGEYWVKDSNHPKGRRRIAESFGKGSQGKRDAYAWKRFIEYQFNYENYKGIKPLSWEELTNAYLKVKKADGIADSSYTEIKNSLLRFQEICGPVPSNKIADYHITEFKINRKKKYKSRKEKEATEDVEKPEEASPRTVNKDLANLSALFTWAVNNHYLKETPEIKMLKQVKKKFIPPDIKTLKKLFAEAKKYPSLYLRMILALATGWRRSTVERISLNIKDDYHINIEKGYIKSLETKTKDEVIKPLGENVINEVNKYTQDCLPEGAKMLFPDRWDGKVREAWDDIRNNVNLPNFTFHNLRNLSVSLLADMGESSATLKDHTGHKQLSTTEGYIGINDESRKRVAEKLNTLFGRII